MVQSSRLTELNKNLQDVDLCHNCLRVTALALCYTSESSEASEASFL